MRNASETSGLSSSSVAKNNSSKIHKSTPKKLKPKKSNKSKPKSKSKSKTKNKSKSSNDSSNDSSSPVLPVEPVIDSSILVSPQDVPSSQSSPLDSLSSDETDGPNPNFKSDISPNHLAETSDSIQDESLPIKTSLQYVPESKSSGNSFNISLASSTLKISKDNIISNTFISSNSVKHNQIEEKNQAKSSEPPGSHSSPTTVNTVTTLTTIVTDTVRDSPQSFQSILSKIEPLPERFRDKHNGPNLPNNNNSILLSPKQLFKPLEIITDAHVTNINTPVSSKHMLQNDGYLSSKPDLPTSSAKKKARFNDILFFEPTICSNDVNISPSKSLEPTLKNKNLEAFHHSSFSTPNKQDRYDKSIDSTSPSPKKIVSPLKSILKCSSSSPIKNVPVFSTSPTQSNPLHQLLSKAKTFYLVSEHLIESLINTLEESSTSDMDNNLEKSNIKSNYKNEIKMHIHTLEEIYSSTFDIQSVVSIDPIFVISCAILNYLQHNPDYESLDHNLADDDTQFLSSSSFNSFPNVKLKIKIYGAIYILLKNRETPISSTVLKAYTPIFLLYAYNDLVKTTSVLENSSTPGIHSSSSPFKKNNNGLSTSASNSQPKTTKTEATLLSKLIGMIGKCLENALNIRYSIDRGPTLVDKFTKSLLKPLSKHNINTSTKSGNSTDDSKAMLIDISRKIFAHVILCFSGKIPPKYITSPFLRLFLSKMARIALTPNMLHQFLVVINNVTSSSDLDTNCNGSSKSCFSSSNLIEILSIYRQYLTVDSIGLNGGTALHSLSIKRRNYMLEHPNSWLPSVILRLIDTNPIISLKSLEILEEILNLFNYRNNVQSPNELNSGGIFDPSLFDPNSDSSLNSSCFALPEPFCKCLLQIFERQIGGNFLFNQKNNNEKTKKTVFDLFIEYFKQAWATRKVSLSSNSGPTTSSLFNKGESSTFLTSSNIITKTFFLNNDAAQHAFNIWRTIFRCFSTIYNIKFTSLSSDELNNGKSSRTANFLFFRWKYWQHWISLMLDQVKYSKDLYSYYQPHSFSNTPVDLSISKNYTPVDIDEFCFKFLRSIFFEWIHFSMMVMTASLNPLGSINPSLNGSSLFDLCFPFSENFELQGFSIFELFKFINLPPIHPYENEIRPGTLSQEFYDIFQKNESTIEKFKKQVHLIGSLRSTIYKTLVFVIISIRIAGIYPEDLSSWNLNGELLPKKVSGCTQDWIKIWDEYFMKFFEIQLSNVSVPVAELVKGIRFLLSDGLYNRNDFFTKNRIQSWTYLNSLNTGVSSSFSEPFNPKCAKDLAKLYLDDPTLTKTNIEEIGKVAIKNKEETFVLSNFKNDKEKPTKFNKNILSSDVVGIALAVSLRFRKSLSFSRSEAQESFYLSLFSELPPQNLNVSLDQNMSTFTLSSLRHEMSTKLWRNTIILLLKSFIHGDLGLQSLPPDVFGIFLELMNICFSVYIKEWKSIEVLDELLQLALIFCVPISQHSKKLFWNYLVNFNVETFEFSLNQENINLNTTNNSKSHKESLTSNEKPNIAVLPFDSAFGVAIISATQVVFTETSQTTGLSKKTLASVEYNPYFPISKIWNLFAEATQKSLENHNISDQATSNISDEDLDALEGNNLNKYIEPIAKRYGVLFRFYNSLAIQLQNYEDEEKDVNIINKSISDLESSFHLLLISFLEKSKNFINTAAKISATRKRKKVIDNERLTSSSKYLSNRKITRSVTRSLDSKDVDSHPFHSYHLSIYIATSIGVLFSEIWSLNFKERLLLILRKSHTNSPKKVIIHQLLIAFSYLEEISFQLDPQIKPMGKIDQEFILLNGLPFILEGDLENFKRVMELHLVIMRSRSICPEIVKECSMAMENTSKHVNLELFKDGETPTGIASFSSRILDFVHTKENSTSDTESWPWYIDAFFFRVFPNYQDILFNNTSWEYLLPIIPKDYFSSLAQYATQIPKDDDRFNNGAMIPDRMYKSAYRALIWGKQRIAKLIMNSNDPISLSKLLGCETEAAMAAGFPFDSDDSTKTFDLQKFWWIDTNPTTDFKKLVNSSAFIEATLAGFCVDDVSMASISVSFFYRVKTSILKQISIPDGNFLETNSSEQQYLFPPVFIGFIYLWRNFCSSFPDKSILSRADFWLFEASKNSREISKYIETNGKNFVGLIKNFKFIKTLQNPDGDLDLDLISKTLGKLTKNDSHFVNDNEQETGSCVVIDTFKGETLVVSSKSDCISQMNNLNQSHDSSGIDLVNRSPIKSSLKRMLPVSNGFKKTKIIDPRFAESNLHQDKVNISTLDHLQRPSKRQKPEPHISKIGETVTEEKIISTTNGESFKEVQDLVSKLEVFISKYNASLPQEENGRNPLNHIPEPLLFNLESKLIEALRISHTNRTPQTKRIP